MINLPFKNSILSWSIKKRIHQIDLFIKYPNDVQHDVFVNLISSGKYSKFGEEHNFKSINSYLDFCKNIPIRTYEELFPYVERSDFDSFDFPQVTIRGVRKIPATTADTLCGPVTYTGYTYDRLNYNWLFAAHAGINFNPIKDMNLRSLILNVAKLYQFLH